MGQVLHGCATTTHAVRAAIQRSKAPVAELAARHGLNRKTMMKWRARGFVQDAPMRPWIGQLEDVGVAVHPGDHQLDPVDPLDVALDQVRLVTADHTLAGPALGRGDVVGRVSMETHVASPPVSCTWWLALKCWVAS